MPTESKKEGTSVENEENNDKNNETSGDYDSVKMSAIGGHNDGNYNESVGTNRFAEVNIK